ncbi:MAG TPA: UDP-N-acetylglucosamine--N-acetylmuramyl-(pentapeptide) pyrophosphoryl-undecaprenol N-acetylglucosamine transferase, partial [Fimbriimonas sp.]
SKGAKVNRTGQPIRKELRDAVSSRIEGEPLVLVLGGSQGSAFLNERVPESQVRGVRYLHAAGRSNMPSFQSRPIPPDYEVVAYLETPQLIDAYRRATVVVARSGGTLAELAMFGLPSVLIPLPTAADDHQHHNAEEFVAMGAATLVPQAEATPQTLRAAVAEWLGDPARRSEAARSLASWDVPDATERIVALVEKASTRK